MIIMILHHRRNCIQKKEVDVFNDIERHETWMQSLYSSKFEILGDAIIHTLEFIFFMLTSKLFGENVLPNS